MENESILPGKEKVIPATQFLKENVTDGKFVPPPPRGYVEILARENNVSARTVTLALQGGTLSRSAILIRKAYMKKYIEPYL